MHTSKTDRLIALSENNGGAQELVWVARVVGRNVKAAVDLAKDKETVDLIGAIGTQILTEIESRMKEHLDKVV